MKTAIIGYGRSGKSAEGILKARGDEVAIVDDKQLVVVSPGVRVMSELEFGVRELKARGILHHTVLYSQELPQKPMELEPPPPGRRAVPASVSWTPSCAGLMLAGYVVQELIRHE